MTGCEPVCSPLKLHIGALYGNIKDFVFGHKEVWGIDQKGLGTELSYEPPQNGITAKRMTVAGWERSILNDLVASFVLKTGNTCLAENYNKWNVAG